MTPLMIAAVDGCTDVVRALIAAGADVNKRDHNGLTALHHAAGAPDRGHTLIVDALLAAGAERAPLSPKGETPAAFARQYGKPWVADRIEQPRE
jgi:ankyrin repeat protein